MKIILEGMANNRPSPVVADIAATLIEEHLSEINAGTYVNPANSAYLTNPIIEATMRLATRHKIKKAHVVDHHITLQIE